ncbi:hypothetical protein [Wenzhouxiangella sp. EGI_FJ10305]|uniref:hypothetical protein n=1 Tax=Wenzhouxiangella sp. EGI_FJ10305 TaxID=3243768 RepID=UPI0035DF3705
MYSEKLTEQLACDPHALLQAMRNFQCWNCDLIYKSRWFSRESLTTLFSRQVPAHPKGWDVLSNRFSPENFEADTEAYSKALQQSDTSQINRYRRALSSIIDSIPELEGSQEEKDLLEAIESGDIETLREATPLLWRVIGEPTPYKRFSGFSAEGLWQYINTTLGNLHSWAEVGCPLWGLLSRAKRNGVDATYLERSEPNYWSTGCRNNGTHCIDHLVRTTGVRVANWSDQPQKIWDAIGAFQYLDHLENPLEFMDELFTRARSCALILDDFSQPTAIQHFTGWTPEAVEFLAEKFAKRVDDGFEPIRASGNRLYLLHE